ncbi:hypothetical protein GZH49_12020 [Nocardia terpenica]|uniref:hypothetical protein n=1 Tax=Nocardia terpenica TaxID=455432 RepID=UPI002FE063B5
MPETGRNARMQEQVDRCGVYRRVFGLDAFPDTGGIYVGAGSVTGVMLPRALAEKVLGTEGLGPVPAVSVDPTVWLLLADTPTCPEQAHHVAIRLMRFGITLVVPRGLLALPTPGDPHRVWIRPPHGRTRPSIAVLADAIAAAATSARNH